MAFKETSFPLECHSVKLSLVIHRSLIDDLQTAGSKELTHVPPVTPGGWPICCVEYTVAFGVLGPLRGWMLAGC